MSGKAAALQLLRGEGEDHSRLEGDLITCEGEDVCAVFSGGAVTQRNAQRSCACHSAVGIYCKGGGCDLFG